MITFTGYDMDDTTVNLAVNQDEDDKIKNPHLLLPIMLFQTHAPNQHLGIMTNRSSEDEATPYTVSRFLKDLFSMGIIIPKEHVLFGRGKNGDPSMNALVELENTFKALALTDHREKASKVWEQMEGLTTLLFEGKNHMISSFLLRCHNPKTNVYHFQAEVYGKTKLEACPKEKLTFVFLDDKKEITDPVPNLGKQFSAVKATDRTENNDEYLFELADKIGLTTYAVDLLKNPQKHADDSPMMRLAALLYAWQRFPEKCPVSQFESFKTTTIDIEQCVRMLFFIQENANKHKDASYRPVGEILRELAPIGLIALSKRIALLNAPVSSASSETDLLADGQKKGQGRFGGLFKTRSLRSSPSPIITESLSQVELLEAEAREWSGKLDSLTSTSVVSLRINSSSSTSTAIASNSPSSYSPRGEPLRSATPDYTASRKSRTSAMSATSSTSKDDSDVLQKRTSKRK